MISGVTDSAKNWKRLFLALEIYVVVTFLFGFHVNLGMTPWSIILGVSLLLAWLFLLIASPFFLSSLRGVALAGWIIAMSIFVLDMLLRTL